MAEAADIQFVQDLCYRCYRAYLLPHDAKAVLMAYIRGEQRMKNPLMDSLLFFLNNPKERNR